MPLSRQEARYIFDQTLGCRYGTTIQGAAYGFMDIVGNGQDGHDPGPTAQQVLRWLQNPQDPEFQPRWDDRLWNTCGVIIGLSDAGTVILVTKAMPTAERYRFGDDELARGDGYSFRKCPHLQQDSQIVAEIEYGEGEAAAEQEDIVEMPAGVEISKAQVQELYDKVMAAIKKLAASS